MNPPSKFLLSVVLFAAPGMAPDTAFALNCTPADISLLSQADVDFFEVNHGPGCDTTTGLLYISGPDISNLDGLAKLRFSNESIVIEANPMLADLSGLGALEAVKRSIFLDSNPMIKNLDDFGALADMSTAVLEIRNCAMLEDISGLVSLTAVHNFAVADSVSLTHIVWPPLLQMATEIAIFSNPNLVSIAGMTGFLNAPSLVLESNNSLQNLDGLASLSNQSLGYLSVANNPQLVSLQGLAGINHVRELGIRNNSQLDSLSGLEGIQSVINNVQIKNNNELTSVNALSNLQSIGGNLEIVENPKLPDLDGLEQISDLGDPINLSCLLWGGCVNLLISNNSMLTDISGLSQLLDVADHLEVIDNPMLDDCTPLARLLDSIDDAAPGPGPLGTPDVGKRVLLAGNMAGCNNLISSNGFE